MEAGRRLDDNPLAEEIELYGELVVAASEASEGEEPLSQDRIDRALGLPEATEAGTSDDPAHPGG